jgi:hypothetical protein
MSSNPPARSWLANLRDPANLTSALKWGVLVAVAYIIVGYLLNLLANAMLAGAPDLTKDPLPLLPLCLLVFASAIAIYIAGYMPAQERGNIATGLLGAVIMIVIAEITSLIIAPPVKSGGTGTTGLIEQIVAILFLVAIGLSVGWIGAIQGVKRGAKTRAKATE